MLEYQLVQAPFRFGVEEGTDPKQVPAGTLTEALNVVWVKSGRLQKRQGITALSTAVVGGGSITAAYRLLTRGDELGLIDGDNQYAFTAGGWVNRGPVSELSATWSVIQDSVQSVQAADSCTLTDGTTVVAWIAGNPQGPGTGGIVYYKTIDSAGFEVIASTVVFSGTTNALRLRVVTDGTTYAILWVEGKNLYSFINGTVTTLQTNVNDTTSLCGFDAQGVGSDFIVAYAVFSTGGINLVRYSFASTPASLATGSVTGETGLGIVAIGIHGTVGETLYIAYADTQNQRVRAATANPATLAQVVAPVNLDTSLTSLSYVYVGVVRKDASSATFVWSIATSTARYVGDLRHMLVTNAGVTYASNHASFLQMLTKPFVVGSKTYVVASNSTIALGFAPSSTVAPLIGADAYVLDVTSTATATASIPRLVAKVDLLLAGFWQRGQVASVTVSGNVATTVTPFISTFTAAETRQGIRNLTMASQFSTPKDMWRPVEVGLETYCAGGVLCAYDGSYPFPIGFAHPPPINMASSIARTTGGSMAAGGYLFTGHGERRSAAGVLHRGPTAVPQVLTVSSGSTGSIDVYFAPMWISLKANSPGVYPFTSTVLAFYRSTVGSSIAQRRTNLVNDFAPGNTEIFTTETSSDALLFLSSQPAVYTASGELDDYQPPAAQTLCLYRSRIYAVCGDGKEVWFSKKFDTPGLAAGFHPDFRLVFDEPITALAVLDDRLVLFSATGIYVYASDGPSVQGDGGGEVPNRLQSDVGCTNPRSVVSSIDGVYFECAGDLQLLTRKLTVEWIGKPVQDLLEDNPNITSAVLVQRFNQIRFTADNGTSSIVLVWDYVERQWSHFVYAGGALIADACVHGGVYTFVTAAGQVYKESESTWLDNGAWVTSRIVTAEIAAAGPLAYHAVRNFRIDGVAASAHGLSISTAFNGDTTYAQTQTWAEGIAGVTLPGPIETANCTMGTLRKSRSVRFKIEDSAPAVLGTGQGALWSSMGIEVGVKKGFGRLAGRQKR